MRLEQQPPAARTTKGELSLFTVDVVGIARASRERIVKIGDGLLEADPVLPLVRAGLPGVPLVPETIHGCSRCKTGAARTGSRQAPTASRVHSSFRFCRQLRPVALAGSDPRAVGSPRPAIGAGAPAMAMKIGVTRLIVPVAGSIDSRQSCSRRYDQYSSELSGSCAPA